MLKRDGPPQRLRVIYRVAMPDDDKLAPLKPIAVEVTLLFGQPVVRGLTHHVQSITPIPTVQSQPIRKRRTLNWWRREREREQP